VLFETPPPSGSPQQAAVVAYRNMWHAFVEAARTSNPDDTNLTKYATGNALTLIVNALTSNRSKGQVVKGDVLLDPTVVGFTPVHEPTEVTISDCVNDENWLVYKDSGGLVDNVPGGKHMTTATVLLSPSGWQVSAFTLRNSGTC
jgi:hypothetical protein